MSSKIDAPPQNEFLDMRTVNAEGNTPLPFLFAKARPTTGWQTFYSNVYQILFGLTQSGTTAQRPTKFLYIGRRYFDTSLGANGGKPIWIASVAAGVATWVDATGAIV